MNPIPSKLLSSCTGGLCNFILVMREDEIHSPAVDVKCFTKMFHRHGRAFDVPTGSTQTPWTFPRGLTRLAALPECKIHRVAFSLVDVHSCSSLHIVQPSF